MAPPDLDALALALVKLSHLVIDLPEVAAVEIDPLLLDARGVLAREARLTVAPATGEGAARLAIRPYPEHLAEEYPLRSGGSVLLRPIRPEDEPAHIAFFERLNPEDVRFRFFNLVRALPHSEMARFTQIDYDREMAFIATRAGADGKPETLGVVRTVTDPDNERTEFAIIVRSDIKGQRLGRAMLEKMIRYCQSRGTRTMVGQVLRENRPMRQLAEELGFRARPVAGEDVVEMTLALNPAALNPADGGAEAAH